MITQYIVVFVLIPGALMDSLCMKKQFDKNHKLIPVWTCCAGYQKVEGELRCVPICKESCGNGTCARPEECQCDKGYQNLNNEIDKGCVPKCSGGCENGHCVAPGECRCNSGYEKVLSQGDGSGSDGDDECVPATSGVSTNKQHGMHKLSNDWIVAIGLIFIVLVIGAILFNKTRNRGKYRVSCRNESSLQLLM